MLIIKRKDRENIDRMIKRYKRKHRKVKLRNELKRRIAFVKPSVKRRREILDAKYRLQEYGKE
ncbi:MAG: small subunit ribosomal protein S21 [Saprospiraceae bacterium]|jgi:small subunit ribosomal protein S21